MYKRRMESLQLQMKNYVFFLILIGAVSVIGTLWDFYNSFRDYQDHVIEYGPLIQLWIEDAVQLLMGGAILFMARNIKRHHFFVASTANLVGFLGCLVILGNITHLVARTMGYGPYTADMKENALGIVLIVLSLILKIGTKIKEENDLTI